MSQASRLSETLFLLFLASACLERVLSTPTPTFSGMSSSTIGGVTTTFFTVDGKFFMCTNGKDCKELKPEEPVPAKPAEPAAKPEEPAPAEPAAKPQEPGNVRESRDAKRIKRSEAQTQTQAQTLNGVTQTQTQAQALERQMTEAQAQAQAQAQGFEPCITPCETPCYEPCINLCKEPKPCEPQY